MVSVQLLWFGFAIFLVAAADWVALVATRPLPDDRPRRTAGALTLVAGAALAFLLLLAGPGQGWGMPMAGHMPGGMPQMPAMPWAPMHR